jgi:hypothetical protein
MPNIPFLIEKEIEILKDEMRALKECQTRYFCLAVTSTGAIFAYLLSGINVFLCNDIQYNAVLNTDTRIDPVFLTPLLIILPLCCIFFDKAQTVYRLVGYYQILECFSLGKCEPNKFVGWENSLNLLRECGRYREKRIKRYLADIYLWENLRYFCKFKYFCTFFGFWVTDQEQNNPCNQCKKTLELCFHCKFPKKSQMYMRLIYLTFLLISVFCFVIIILPLFLCAPKDNLWEIYRINKVTIILTYILFIFSFNTFIYNLKIIYQLEMGFHSFKANHIFWEKILFKDFEEIETEIQEKFAELKTTKETEQKKGEEERKKKDKNRIYCFIIHCFVILMLYSIDYL